MVRKFIAEHEKKEIEKVVENTPHEVVFTPAYHYDLQPIELVWALVKGNIGRQYIRHQTFTNVYNLLVEEFKKLETTGHEVIGKMIDKTTNLAMEMHCNLELDDGEDQIDLNEPDSIEFVDSDEDANESE